MISITKAGIAPSSAVLSSSLWDTGAEINSRTTHHCDDLSWVPADSRIFRVSVSVGVVKGWHIGILVCIMMYNCRRMLPVQYSMAVFYLSTLYAELNDRGRMVLTTYQPRHLMDRDMAMICMPRKWTTNNNMQKSPLLPRSPISLDLDCSVELSREWWKKERSKLSKKLLAEKRLPYKNSKLDNHLSSTFGICRHHGFFFA